MLPRVLTIGGLDPCGGAGIGADVRMISRCGGEAAAVATCLTVQNRHGFLRAEACDPALIGDAIAAVLADRTVSAIKLGMAFEPSSLLAALASLEQAGYRGPLVVDPVLSVSSGGWQAEQQLVDVLLERVLPRTTLLTPNLPELDRLSSDGSPEQLLDRGVQAVLVKGGHGEGDTLLDLLLTADSRKEFRHPRLSCGPVHGTGCALSSAIATYLARDHSIEEAVAKAVAEVQQCLAATRPADDGLAVPLQI